VKKADLERLRALCLAPPEATELIARPDTGE
jgi:hypothetical protein